MRLAILLIGMIIMPVIALAKPPVINPDRICIPIQIIQQGQVLDLSMELAVTPETSRRGLMYRDFLPPLGGMLFVFHPPQPVTMWMKNTMIPLDMLFVSKDMQIIHIHPHAVPFDLTPLSSKGIIQYVIELRGGTAAKYGITTGDRVILPGGLLNFQ